MAQQVSKLRYQTHEGFNQFQLVGHATLISSVRRGAVALQGLYRAKSCSMPRLPASYWAETCVTVADKNHVILLAHSEFNFERDRRQPWDKGNGVASRYNLGRQYRRKLEPSATLVEACDWWDACSEHHPIINQPYSKQTVLRTLHRAMWEKDENKSHPGHLRRSFWSAMLIQTRFAAKW